MNPTRRTPLSPEMRAAVARWEDQPSFATAALDLARHVAFIEQDVKPDPFWSLVLAPSSN